MLKLKTRGGLPLRGGDLIADFRGHDWRFLYVTNGPVSYAKVVVEDTTEVAGQAPAIREFFPLVFPQVFLIAEGTP